MACDGLLAQKINGLCTVAPKFEVLDEHFDHIIQINANWIAVVPYAFCDPAKPKVVYNHPHQWAGEKPEGIINTIALAKKRGLKVMIKPHLWVKGQGWAGQLSFDNKTDLNLWQESYLEYLLVYANIADSLNVELISIGTELKELIVENEDYWIDLSCAIRNVYDGKLTYSSNWDNYQKVKIWDQMDFIGIDSYFPINDELTPTATDVENSFKNVKSDLKDFSKKTMKPVLFTEYGFRSIDHCANGHYIGDYEKGSVNLVCQQNAYQGLFNAFWNEEWFAGGFVWKWFFNHGQAGGKTDDRFTPQNKPANQIIQSNYTW